MNIGKLFFFLGLLLISFLEGKSKDKNTGSFAHELGVIAIFRDEAPYLKEWIEFHKLIGATHFYLYNNLSEDHYQEVLQPYIESGVVELIEWPMETVVPKMWVPIQTAAYKNALNKAKGICRWVAILDTDEYLFSPLVDSVPEVLTHYEGYGGVVANWQMFGTSNVDSIPEDRLMIEMLVMKGPTFQPENSFIKSIVHPHCVETCKDPHKMIYKEGYYAVNTKRSIVHNSTSPGILIDRLRINHYWTRDEAYFYGQKIQRRGKWREGAAGVIERKERLNAEADGAILRFVPALRHAMGFTD